MQQQQASMAGVGVPVPYPMASIVPFPLAYSFLSGTAPVPNPPAQLSGVPVYLPAPNGAPVSGPNATFSYAPPIPGLQYFSSVPMPMGPTSAPPNAPPGPSPLLPSGGVGSAGGSRPPPSMAPPPLSLQPLIGGHSSVGNSTVLQAPPMYVTQSNASLRSPPGSTAVAGGNISNQQNQLTPTQLNFLLAAYRVGIVALETLGRRAHDDRPQARYSRNPPYGEDVKWLLSVAKKLGNSSSNHELVNIIIIHCIIIVIIIVMIMI